MLPKSSGFIKWWQRSLNLNTASATPSQGTRKAVSHACWHVTVYRSSSNRCPFTWQCLVNSPLNILSWFLLSWSNSPDFCADSFLRKPLGCLFPPMDCQCSWHFLLIQSLINPLKIFADIPREGSGPVSGIAETCLANWSAVSFPSIPTCPSTHTSSILLHSASFTRHWWQSQNDLEFIWNCSAPWWLPDCRQGCRGSPFLYSLLYKH